MEKRRKFKRVAFREAVRYQIREGFIPESSQGNSWGGCCGCDLSEGGARLHMNDFVPLNARVSVSFQMGSDCINDLEGKVVWVQKVPCSESYQMGLEFDNSGSSAKLKSDIRQYIVSSPGTNQERNCR